MLRFDRAFICAAALLAASCETFQSAGGAAGASASKEPPAPPSFENGSALMALPGEGLAPKSCGGILWTLSAQRPIPIFRYTANEEGEINLNGTVLKMKPVELAGDYSFGVYERMTFESEIGVRVEVESTFGPGFDGGAYIQSAVIKLTDGKGWTAVSPGAGVAGCRSF